MNLYVSIVKIILYLILTFKVYIFNKSSNLFFEKSILWATHTLLFTKLILECILWQFRNKSASYVGVTKMPLAFYSYFYFPLVAVIKTP